MLRDVESSDVKFLYTLLLERPTYPKEYRTSKRDLPSFETHKEFVLGYITKTKTEYDAFYMILIGHKGKHVRTGSIVLKKNGEWGYHILNKYQNMGIGSKASQKLIRKFSNRRLWGSVRPGNKRAIHMLEKNGHKLVALVYERKPKKI